MESPTASFTIQDSFKRSRSDNLGSAIHEFDVGHLGEFGDGPNKALEFELHAEFEVFKFSARELVAIVWTQQSLDFVNILGDGTQFEGLDDSTTSIDETLQCEILEKHDLCADFQVEIFGRLTLFKELVLHEHVLDLMASKYGDIVM